MKLVFAVDYDDGTVQAKAGDEVSGLPPHRIGVLRRAGVIAVAPDPLDHDGDGRRGGSPKGARSTRARGARRKADENTSYAALMQGSEAERRQP